MNQLRMGEGRQETSTGVVQLGLYEWYFSARITCTDYPNALFHGGLRVAVYFS